MPPVTFGQSLPTIEVPEDVLYQAQSCITTQLILADLTDEDFSRQSLPGKPGIMSEHPQGSTFEGRQALKTALDATTSAGGAEKAKLYHQLKAISTDLAIARIMQLSLQLAAVKVKQEEGIELRIELSRSMESINSYKALTQRQHLKCSSVQEKEEIVDSILKVFISDRRAPTMTNKIGVPSMSEWLDKALKVTTRVIPYSYLDFRSIVAKAQVDYAAPNRTETISVLLNGDEFRQSPAQRSFAGPTEDAYSLMASTSKICAWRAMGFGSTLHTPEHTNCTETISVLLNGDEFRQSPAQRSFAGPTKDAYPLMASTSKNCAWRAMGFGSTLHTPEHANQIISCTTWLLGNGGELEQTLSHRFVNGTNKDSHRVTSCLFKNCTSSVMGSGCTLEHADAADAGQILGAKSILLSSTLVECDP
jgi:hypothetical protein